MNLKITTSVLAAIFCCVNSIYSASATWTWTGNANTSDWTDKSNWSTTDPIATPGGDDLIVINAGANVYPVLTANTTVNDFIMNGGWMFTVDFNFTSINDITIYDGAFHSDDSRINADNLYLFDGYMNINGNRIIINDNVVIDGGLLNVFAFEAVIPDDLFLISGSLDLNSNDLTVNDEFIYDASPFTVLNAGKISVDNLIIDFAGTSTLPYNLNVLSSAVFISGILNTSSTAMLIFDNNATASGASNSTHVSGPVRRLVAGSGNTTFEFPIGNGSVFAPIGITNFAQARSQDYFTAQYDKVSAPYNHASKDTTLNHISDAEYWVLDRDATAGTPSTDVFVRLSFNENDRSGLVDVASQLRIARWDGTKWVDHGYTSATGNNTAGTFTSSARVTSFSPFTIGSSTGLNPLPVSLLNFNAVAADKQVKINWSTSSEIDNDFFTVQKSLDGKSWSVIGIVNGIENSTQFTNYSSIDRAPVNGLQFYRLIQTDINGLSTTSNIVTVNLINGDIVPATVTLFPNPANNIVNVNLSEMVSDATITVFNNMGMKVMELQNQSGKMFVLDMTKFETGIYTIEVRHESGVNFSKILKN